MRKRKTELIALAGLAARSLCAKKCMNTLKMESALLFLRKLTLSEAAVCVKFIFMLFFAFSLRKISSDALELILLEIYVK